MPSEVGVSSEHIVISVTALELEGVSGPTAGRGARAEAVPLTVYFVGVAKCKFIRVFGM